MKKLLLLAALFVAVVSAHAVSLILPSGQTVEFTLPERWTIGAVPPLPPGTPAPGKTVSYVPTNKANSAVVLTFITAKDDSLAEAEALKTMHESANDHYVAGSVEGQLVSNELKLAAGRGYFSPFTDNALVDQPVQKGSFKTITVATIYLGNRVIVTASVFSDDQAGPEHRQGMKLLESLHLRSKPPARI